METENCEEPLEIMELFKSRLCMDAFWDESATTLEERAGVTEEDLSPFYFDFEEQWAKINSEMKDKVENYSDLFAEIVEANKEVAISEMGIHVEDEDILDGLFNEDVLMIPPMETVKDRIGVVDSKRKRSETHHVDEHTVKKMKGGKRHNQQDTQFVFVNDVATNEKKVITLRKGEDVPAGFEVASIRGKLPPVPNELASFPLPKLQDLITKRASPSPPRNQLSNSSPSTPTRGSPKSTGLNSLSDLMNSEMEKKSRLKNKQGPSTSPARLVSIISNSVPSQANLVPAQSGLEISPVTDHHFLLEKSHFEVKKFQPNPIQTPRPSVKSVSAVQTQKPSLSVLPLGQNTVSTTGRVVRTVLICKLCGEIFPFHMDHLFRKHMFAKHDVEIGDETQCFEQSKATSAQFLRCRKCKAVVPNKYEEHKLRCLPLVAREAAFEEINMSGFSIGHHVCGIGECREVFKSRYLLHNHVKRDHRRYAKTMIVDPYFRCCQCLKRFDEAYALGKHCVTCTDMQPRKETIIELIQGILDCDICGEKHQELGAATSCSFNKGIFHCVLCLAVIKNRKNIYLHLHEYHGLQLSESEESVGSKLTMDCPICDVKPDKYTVIFSHIVTEHYTSVFVNNPSAFSRTIPIVQQKQTQGLESNSAARRPSPIVSSTGATGNTVLTKKLPDLTPLPGVVVGMPPGIRINTNRLSPLVTVTSGDGRTISPQQSTAGFAMRNPQSQIYSQKKIILLHNPNPSSSAPPKGPIAFNFGQSGTSPSVLTRTMLVNPVTTAQTPVIEIPTAVRQTMAALTKTGTPSAPRQPQVQLVRPLSTSAPLIIRPNASTTVSSQIRASSIPGVLISNTSPVSHGAAAARTMPGQLIVTANPTQRQQGNGATVMNAVAIASPRISTSATFSAPIASGEFTVTQPSLRTGPVISVRPPIISASSSLTINAITTRQPAVTTTGNIVTGSTTVSAGASATDQTNSAASTVTTTAIVSKHNAAIAPASPTTNKAASRIVTIGGRTFEYQVIQSKLANKSHAVTQSASGKTSVRHTPFPPNFKIPATPTASSSRLIGPTQGPQEKSKDGNGTPSQNLSSNNS